MSRYDVGRMYMLRFSKMPALVAATLSTMALLAPARAAVVRAWVSGHGNDVAGCGAPTNPCRTLQYTHDSVVAAGGEIDILDPAGYGTLTITKAISIVNDGVGTAGVQASSGNGITITAGPSDVIRLRGLNIEGLNTAADGIQFNTGAYLSVEDCTVKDFTNAEINFQPTVVSHLYVSNSKIEHTTGFGVGVWIVPSVSASAGANAMVEAAFEHVESTDNEAGILVNGANSNANVKLRVTVADSMLSDNGIYGIYAGSGSGDASTFVMVRDTTISNTGGNAIFLLNDATVFVDRSTLSGNIDAFGVAGSGSTLGSYGNNSTDGNIALGTPPTIESFH
jgi:hypothetical protein